MKLLGKLRYSKNLSERDVARSAGIARATLRSLEAEPRSSRPEILDQVLQLFSRQAILALVPSEPAASEQSIVAISIAIVNQGFESWKIYLMDFVDEFRRSMDARLVLLPPVKALDPRLRALMASTTTALCAESGIDVPDWARRSYFLDEPWFLSGMESLKAMAILESPVEFRRNNIFVHDNFLQRA